MESQIQNTDKKKEAKKIGGLLFAGCMFIGMAIGWYAGHLTIGLFSGMGIGFIMLAVVILSHANNPDVSDKINR